MRKKVFGRKLKRDINERKALFRSLMGSLVIYGKIKTTEAKAKSIKGEIEKLVTHAKNKGDESRNILTSRLVNDKVVDKMINEIAPLFKERPGGYTRIIRVAPRVKDNARMVLMTWVEEVKPTSVKEPKRNKVEKAEKPKTEKKETKTKEKKAKAKK